MEALLQDKALRESLTVASPKRVSWQLRTWSRLKAVAMLWVLFFITLPLSIAGMAFAIAHHNYKSNNRRKRSPPPVGSRGTALVSGMPLRPGVLHVAKFACALTGCLQTKTGLLLQVATRAKRLLSFDICIELAGGWYWSRCKRELFMSCIARHPVKSWYSFFI